MPDHPFRYSDWHPDTSRDWHPVARCLSVGCRGSCHGGSCLSGRSSPACAIGAGRSASGFPVPRRSGRFCGAFPGSTGAQPLRNPLCHRGPRPGGGTVLCRLGIGDSEPHSLMRAQDRPTGAGAGLRAGGRREDLAVRAMGFAQESGYNKEVTVLRCILHGIREASA